MDRRFIIILLSVFVVFLLLPMANTPNPASNTSPMSGASSTPQPIGGEVALASFQDQASWWNSSYIYRRYFNFTEPGVTDRTLTPVHLYLTFEDGHCYVGSIRVAYYDNPTWTLLPFQIWNTTYDQSGDFILSTRVSFMINVSSGATESNYYIYYTKSNVGSVSYPDFYPFIYKSYTFSLLSLVSFYDNNNYRIEMYSPSAQTWNDPRDIDARWAGTSGSVYPTNVPNGTLNQNQAARYEPSTYSDTLFNGYYAVYSNYPMYVHMGQGDEGSNPAINDWFPIVDALGSGTGTQFLIGGVEGFPSRNEGKYWIQAQEDDTEVWVVSSDGSADTGWVFYNNSAVSSWPVTLNAGEYIFRGQLVYSEIKAVNSTRPVSARGGDDDASYARDIWGFYPAVNGALTGEEFYTIDMGNSNDKTRITNLGSTAVNVDWYRNSGSGFVFGGTLSIPANSSSTIASGTASATNPEDILHIVGPTGSVLMVEGVYNPTTSTDGGDWVPSVSGYRYGTTYKLWGTNSYKFMIVATENAKVTISGYNGGTLEIPAGGMASFRPVSSSMTLYHVVSNASIGIVDVGKFSTSSPYSPTGDTGYGWAVPTYSSNEDQNGFVIASSEERHLYEFDITVVDIDNTVVAGARVTLYNATTHALWLDEQGNNRTGLTDSNGFVIFEGLNGGTYEIHTQIDAKAWLTTSYSHVWVSDTSNHGITGSVTPVEIMLPMGSFDITLNDLMGNPMAQTTDETTRVRASNITGPSANGDSYIGQQATDASGKVSFYRLPKDDYRFFVKYDGNDSSYQYDQLLEFGNWSRAAADFDTGPYSYAFTVPLVTLRVTTMSWDDQPIGGATIKINNTVDENVYSLTRTTDANGRYNFYRIVNGTWQFDVWKADNYPETPLARNNTEVLSDIQDEVSYTVELPITRLNIRVLTGPNTFVQGAQVNVTLRGGDLVATGNTNSTGQLTFQYIHANLSSPYFVSYNVTVIAGNAQNGFMTEILLKADKDWSYINNITISIPAYSDSYTELNSTVAYLTAKWGRNATFTIGYYDRDGPSTTLAVVIGASTWVNFTVYAGSTPIGWGYWSMATDYYVSKVTSIDFLITVDTDLWGMHVSETPYTIVINTHTDGYDDPDPITVYLTINPAQTSLGVSDYSYTEQYGNHSSHDYWLFDTTNSMNVTGLDVYSYVVKLGALEVRSGTLGISGHLYRILPSVLNGLNTGVYSVTINLQKRDYTNQSLAVGVTIIDIPMKVTLVSTPNYMWDPTTIGYAFEYSLAGNATVPTLSNVQVLISWYTDTGTSYLNVTRTLSVSGGVLTYTFARSILPVGLWNLTVTCVKANYKVATATITNVLNFIAVSEAATAVSPVSSSSATVDWLSPAVFEVSFTRSSDSAGLTGASFSDNWTDTVSVQGLGGGVYRITVSTRVEAGTKVLRLYLMKDNHEDGLVDLTITIKVPLLIVSEYGSIENPLEVYWTKSFVLSITLYDQSRANTTVDGATVSFSWYLESVVDKSGNLDAFSDGIYNLTLNAFDAVPQEALYGILITATLPGGTKDDLTVFVRIDAVPNEVVLDQQYFEVFYADIFTVRFYWNNTLDNLPITSADSESYDLIPLGIPITDSVNEGGGWYSLTVNTRTLGMSANVQGSVYVIHITMARSGFQAHDLTTVIILVRETDASLVIHPIDNVNWSDSFTVRANLYDALHGQLIWLGASILMRYGTYSTSMTNYLNGTFTAIINSKNWFPASSTAYVLTFVYTLPNYIDSTNTSSVIVNPIPGSIFVGTPTSSEWTWSQDFELRVQVWNEYSASPELMEYATVLYMWQGFSTTGQLIYQTTSRTYNTTVSTEDVPAGTRYLIVRVVNDNFTISDKVIKMEIDSVHAVLTSDKDIYDIVYGEGTGRIFLTYTIDDTTVDLAGILSNANITVIYGGALFSATYQASTQQYLLAFNPQEIDASLIPMVMTLSIKAELENYTTAILSPTLRLIAKTTFETAGDDFRIEEGQTMVVWFQFLKQTGTSSTPIAPANVSTIEVAISGNLVYSLGNGINYDAETGRYWFNLFSGDVGVRSQTPYILSVTLMAPLCQNITTSTQQTARLSITVTEATVDLLGPFSFLGLNLGSFRIPVSLFQTFLLMASAFVMIGASVVAVRRWRVPFAIKQINKALKQMLKGKAAKVEKIKSMGAVVSELLAPGLAELDLAAPMIEAGPESDYAIDTAETEEILQELDILGEVGGEEAVSAGETTADFESELEAELDTIVDTESPRGAPAEPSEPSEEASAEEPEPSKEGPDERQVDSSGPTEGSSGSLDEKSESSPVESGRDEDESNPDNSMDETSASDEVSTDSQTPENNAEQADAEDVSGEEGGSEDESSESEDTAELTSTGEAGVSDDDSEAGDDEMGSINSDEALTDLPDDDSESEDTQDSDEYAEGALPDDDEFDWDEDDDASDV